MSQLYPCFLFRVGEAEPASCESKSLAKDNLVDKVLALRLQIIDFEVPLLDFVGEVFELHLRTVREVKELLLRHSVEPSHHQTNLSPPFHESSCDISTWTAGTINVN